MQTIICQHCNATISKQSRFCGSCGTKVTFAKAERERKSLQLVILFYLLYLAYAIIAFVVSGEDFELGTEIAMESIFILLTLAFSLFDFKNIFRLYTFKTLNWKTCCSVSCFRLLRLSWCITSMNGSIGTCSILATMYFICIPITQICCFGCLCFIPCSLPYLKN